MFIGPSKIDGPPPFLDSYQELKEDFLLFILYTRGGRLGDRPLLTSSCRCRTSRDENPDPSAERRDVDRIRFDDPHSILLRLQDDERVGERNLDRPAVRFHGREDVHPIELGQLTVVAATTAWSDDVVDANRIVVGDFPLNEDHSYPCTLRGTVDRVQWNEEVETISLKEDSRHPLRDSRVKLSIKSDDHCLVLIDVVVHIDEIDNLEADLACWLARLRDLIEVNRVIGAYDLIRRNVDGDRRRYNRRVLRDRRERNSKRHQERTNDHTTREAVHPDSFCGTHLITSRDPDA